MSQALLLAAADDGGLACVLTFIMWACIVVGTGSLVVIAHALVLIAARLEGLQGEPRAKDTVDSLGGHLNGEPVIDYALRTGSTALEVVADIKKGSLPGFLRDGKWFVDAPKQD